MAAPDVRRRWAPAVGLVAAALLVAAAVLVPQLADWDVATRAPRSAHSGLVAPLHGYWHLVPFGPGTVPAVLLALLSWRYAIGLAERLGWRRLLLASYVVALVWMVSLALVDGTDGLSRVLGDPYEYLRTARSVDDVPGLLHGYVDRIPLDAPRNWPTAVAGHPPGILLFFVALVRLGLGGDLAAGLVVVTLAATTVPAVLVTLRALGAEPVARRAAPFLVLTPSAVYMAVSADALFAAVGAWGLACLAIATRSRRWLPWSVLAGLLLGYLVMMSYGLPLMGVLALAVLHLGRAWRPLPVAAGAALVVVLGFAAAGFSWWEAYPVLHDRYWDGIAADRPASYWMWGNLAALVICAGPLLGAGLGQLASLRRRADPAVLLLVSAAVVAIAAADLSRMSKAEVERIWLPFVPWLMLSVTLLPPRWRRAGLGLQVVCALLLQHLVYTDW